MNVEVLADDQPDNSFDDAMVIWLDVQLFLLLQDSFSVSASVDTLILDKTIQHFNGLGYCLKTRKKLLKLVSFRRSRDFDHGRFDGDCNLFYA